MQRGMSAFFCRRVFQRCFVFLLLLFLQAAPSLWSQVSVFPGAEPLSFVGMRVDELIRRFGPPQTVYAARGQQIWQDDVVFVYGEGEFYIHRDRVWQIRLPSAFGMQVGDARAVALMVLGNNMRDGGNYLLCDIVGYAWPLSLRVNIDAGRISAIYIYRPDY